MKAKEATTDAKELLDKLGNMESGFSRDVNFLEYAVGKSGSPAKNQIRLVGEIEACRVHYISDFVSDDDNLSRIFVCPGRSKCPVCSVVDKLYKMGDDKAKEQAGQLKNKEKNYWNCIPKWPDYDWGDDGKRCLVLTFGITARRALTKMVEGYGHPGDIESGYDVIYEVEEKKQGGWGNDYDMYPQTTRQKEKGRIADIVETTPLTEEEREYEMVDLTKYAQPPSEDVLSKIAEIFELSVSTKDAETKREQANAEEDNGNVKEDIEEKEEELLCFGMPNVYDPKSSGCKNCEEFKKCGLEVRKAKIEELRKGGKKNGNE